MARLMQPGDLCLVTGVSGYLASWIAKDLLEQGLRVRGTLRNLDDTARLDTLRALLPGVELVAADLRAPEGWRAAVEGCRFVFHVASPQAVPGERDRTGGAVGGTGHLMRAALGAASVEKIVLTSSEAAIAYGFPRSKQRFTEDDWTVLDGPAGRNDYFRSKTLAERLAWELAADPALNPRRVPLATVNPGFIAGPSLVPWARFSLAMLKAIAEGRMPLLPDMVTHVVDVRDCARMHIAVMDDPASGGRRHFSFAVAARMVEMARIIRDAYGDMGLRPRTWVMPSWALRLLALVWGEAGSLASKLGHPNLYETKWPGVYRYAHTDLAAIIAASMDSMLAHGWIRPKTPRAAGALPAA